MISVVLRVFVVVLAFVAGAAAGRRAEQLATAARDQVDMAAVADEFGPVAMGLVEPRPTLRRVK